jgi:Xaa-Pro dipeptidase
MVEGLQHAMTDAGLVWEHGPNVSVNANSVDGHYEPTAQAHSPIRSSDFLLIDIWARPNREATVFYDITWTGVVDREPTAQEQSVFTIVRNARDAAIAKVKQAFAAGKPIAGWEADDAARAVIREAGYAESFTHRTGHNIATELHGNGAHLDNLETHDERLLLPHTCFSVEPGIYLKDFGIRSEVNMMTGDREAHVTGRVQTELVRV